MNYSTTTPDDTLFDYTDKGALRPNEDPLRTKVEAFKAMKLPNWDWEITIPETVSLYHPITLFALYCTLKSLN
jgi:asparagine synthetase A